MDAIQIEVSDGTMHVVNVSLEFFGQSDIEVTLGDAKLPLVEGVGYQWTAPQVITFLSTVDTPSGIVPNGVTVTLRRQTENDSMFNIYDGGAPFSRTSLDENFLQLLRLSQEFSEGLGLEGLRQDLDMHGYRIRNLGDPVLAGDAVSKGVADAATAKSLRTPEDVAVLPSAATRANKVLAFDAVGNPIVSVPAGGSAAALAIDLANAVDPLKGAGMVGYMGHTVADELNARNVDLANSSDLTKGAALVGRAVRHINDIAELKTVPGRYASDLIVLARHTAGFNFGGGPFRWNSSSVVANNDVTVIQVTGVVTGRWERLGAEAVNVGMFGARPVAGFNNTTAFTNARDFIAGEAAAFRPVPRLEFAPGTYEFGTGINWAVRGATIINLGKVKLRNTGTGSAVILDAGVGSNLTGITFGQGNGFIIESGPTATAATVFVRNIYKSDIRYRVWGGGLTQAGSSILGCVLTKFHIASTPTESSSEAPADYTNGWYLGGKPQFGKVVDASAVGAPTAYCIFYNWLGAACQFGMYIASTLGNLWEGGDNEYNTTNGCVFTAAAIANRVRGMNFEVNTVSDVELTGNFNSFDCDSVLFRIIGGSGNRLIGGVHNQVSVVAGTGHYVGEIVYGRGLSGNLTILDTASRTRFGECYQAQTSTWSRGPALRAGVVLGASPATYTNNRGRTVRIAISGGTVSNTSYYRGGTIVTAVGTTNLMVPVSAGDSLIITYSALPTVTELEE